MSEGESRFFLSYSGRGLPLNLVSPLSKEELENRNTYFRASYDDQGRLVVCEKVVYGEVELRHSYSYGSGGALVGAIIEMDGEQTEISFDGEGRQISPSA
jgi:hypothetical protein